MCVHMCVYTYVSINIVLLIIPTFMNSYSKKTWKKQRIMHKRCSKLSISSYNNNRLTVSEHFHLS